jgi:hypothetical protein
MIRKRGLSLLLSLLALTLLTVGHLPNVKAFTFEIDYSDPANDVMVLYSTNNTPVLTGGSYTFSADHSFIDVNWIRTRDIGASVRIHFEMKDNAVNQANTSYIVNLYTDSTNATHYRVNYTNGLLWLESNATGFVPLNITGNGTITSNCVVATGRPNTICVTLEKSLLGNITAWNVDGTAVMRGNPALGQLYTYQDFGWEVPGNPGSSPTVIQGHVTRADTGQPLVGANVSTDVGGYFTLTDSTGAYILSVAPGTYNVTAALKGYYPQTQLAILVQGQGLILDFALDPKPTVIMGYVYEAGTTRGLAGVNVSTNLGGYWTLTDAEGFYSLTVVPGTYNVTASIEGFFPESETVALAQGDELRLDLSLAPIPIYQTPLGIAAILIGVLGSTFLLLLLLLARRRRGSGGFPPSPPLR